MTFNAMMYTMYTITIHIVHVCEDAEYILITYKDKIINYCCTYVYCSSSSGFYNHYFVSDYYTGYGVPIAKSLSISAIHYP